MATTSTTSNNTINSFSNLLRRTKLISFNPKIDQIYTSNSSNLNKSNLGLKRNLPGLNSSNGSGNNRSSNYFKLINLDNKERRTNFRKSSKEFFYLKKFEELQEIKFNNSNNNSSSSFNDNGRTSTSSGSSSRGDVTETRHFTTGRNGTIQPIINQTNLEDLLTSQNNKKIIKLNLTKQSKTLPNYLSLTESDFELLLNKLNSKREEFKLFLLEEEKLDKSNKSKKDYLPSSTSSTSEDSIDLYEKAQAKPSTLSEKIEKFLLQSLPTSQPSTHPSPLPHPTLGIQFSPPTSLESARSPSIPGRILGPSPTNAQKSSSSSKSSTYSLLLSTITPIENNLTAGSSGTTWFPDSDGIRDNKLGREMFKLDPNFKFGIESFSRYESIQSTRGKKLMINGVLGGMGGGNNGGAGVDSVGTEGQESHVLTLNSIELKARVFDGKDLDLPGTQAYSGNLPPSINTNRRNELNLGLLTSSTKGEEYLNNFGGSRSLLQIKNNSISGGTQREINSRRLRDERLATDSKSFGLNNTTKRAGQKKGNGNGNGKKNPLLSTLQDLLDNN